MTEDAAEAAAVETTHAPNKSSSGDASRNSTSAEDTSTEPNRGREPTETKQPAPSTPPRATTVASTPAAAEEPAYDAEYAGMFLGWVVEDVAIADERVMDGIMAHSTLANLAKTMGRLQDLGAPPGVSAGEVYALTGALQETYQRASDYFSAGNQLDGSAAYSVAREHTAELLALLNPALGSDYRLPG